MAVESADEAIEQIAEEKAAETAEEIVESTTNDNDGDDTTVVVVNEDNEDPVEEVNEALDTAERIRSIAREEAQTATTELSRSFGEVIGATVNAALAEHIATMPHNPVVETATVEPDEPPTPQHWYFRNRKRSNNE